MENLTFETPVSSSLEEVKKSFDIDLFKALKPPGLQLEVERFDGCKKGDEVHLKVGLGLKVKWVSLITEDNESEHEWYFIDEGKTLPFPLKKWHHRHRVIRQNSGSLIVDDIHFSTGSALIDFVMRHVLTFQFKGRGPVYQRVFGKPS